MTILHLLPGLGIGGAEMLLVRLLQSRRAGSHQHEVVALGEDGPLRAELEAAGARVTALNLRRNSIRPWALPVLASLIRQRQPSVLHTWMYHANLAGALLRPLLPGIPVIWSIHNSRLTAGRSRRLTRAVNRACAFLSPTVRRVVYCSRDGQQVHELQGYHPGRSICIPNGFDTELFRPDPAARTSVRSELGLTPDSTLVGLVARFDPDKDHQTFFRAAARLLPQFPNLHFVLCGAGTERSNPQLMQLAADSGVSSSVHLLGLRTDVPRIMAALDLLCLSSVSEAFPNVLGEAMCCGVPCVSTNAGDAAEILGNTGSLCEPGNPESLATALTQMLRMPPRQRAESGLAGRERVRTRYSIEAITNRYSELWSAEGGS